MLKSEFSHYTEEKVTVLTEGEKIEGMLFYVGGTRLSDFLNSPNQQEFKFIKIKDPTVHCRRTGEELSKVSFVMVARDQIVMVMVHTPPSESDPGFPEPIALQRERESASRAPRY